MTMAKSNEISAKESRQVAKALEIMFATGYISKKKLYWENFVRGFFGSIGAVVGATIGIALLLWALSLFKTVPLIGPLLRNAQQTIQKAGK